MSQLRVAVVGAGHLGKIHARLIQTMPEYNLVAVADPVAAARQAIQEQLGVNTVADYHTLPGSVDAVVIAAPTSLHHTIATWSLKHRLHTFVEKPMVPTAAQAFELNALAERSQCVLQVGHVERFNTAWTSVRPYLDHPRFIEAVRESNYSGRSTDVGVVLDLMIHDLDLVLNIAQSDVVRVEATGHALLGQHEDIAEARIEFENGCVANLKASRVSRTGTRRMNVLAESGMVEVDFGSAKAEVVTFGSEVRNRRFAADMLPTEERLRVKDELFTRWMPHQSVPVPTGNAIQAELLDFAKAIRGQHLPQVTGEQAYRVLQVAEAILLEVRKSTADSSAIPAQYTAYPIRRAA